MRKFIFALSFLLLSISSFAQLNVQSETEKIERIGTLRFTYSYVYVQGTTYFLGINTSNRFDDGTFFALGNSAKSAILTAEDLIKALESMDKGASIKVIDAEGTDAYIMKKTMLGKPYLVIKMSNQAGDSNITGSELEKAITIIQRHAKIEEEPPVEDDLVDNNGE